MQCFFIWSEVKFFKVATNQANCDWLTIFLNMVHLYQNKNVKTLIVTVLSQKSENNIANIKKTKNYQKKTQMTLKNYILISQRKEKKKDSWVCGCFLPKPKYHSILQRIIPILKVNFNLTFGVFLKLWLF